MHDSRFPTCLPVVSIDMGATYMYPYIWMGNLGFFGNGFEIFVKDDQKTETKKNLLENFKMIVLKSNRFETF